MLLYGLSNEVVSYIYVFLSLNKVTLVRLRQPSFFKTFMQKVASLASSERHMYSASVDERATVRCFLLHQDITPPDRIKAYPVYDLRSNSQLPQSASAIPIRLLLSFVKISPLSIVPWRYRSTLFAAFQCRTSWQLLNWLR